MADAPQEPPVREGWKGVAATSQSIWCGPEPRNTKAIFARVVQRACALLTERLGDVWFIEVGANDGISADHIRPFVASGRWHGVLVEPGAAAADRLEALYAGRDDLSVVRKAVWSEAGTMPFYIVDAVDVLSSLSLDAIMAHEGKYEDLRSMIRTVEMETTTLEAIIADRALARVDMVAVDTEGCDDRVLDGLDIEARRPGLILFEHWALSAARSQALKERLEAAGYAIIHDRHDALAVAKGVIDPGELRFLAEVVETARNG